MGTRSTARWARAHLTVAATLGVAGKVHAARERVAAQVDADHAIDAQGRDPRGERFAVFRRHLGNRGWRIALAIAWDDEQQRRALGPSRQALFEARRAVGVVAGLERHNLRRAPPQV